MEWLVGKVMKLHQKGNSGAVPNPTLEEICQILSKSLLALTPATQRKAFEHCLLTLPVDGSLDDEKGSKNTMALLRKHGEILVPTPENAFELFPFENGDGDGECREGRMTAICESLVQRTKEVLVEEDFALDPQEFSVDSRDFSPPRLPTLLGKAALKAVKKEGNR